MDAKALQPLRELALASLSFAYLRNTVLTVSKDAERQGLAAILPSSDDIQRWAKARVDREFPYAFVGEATWLSLLSRHATARDAVKEVSVTELIDQIDRLLVFGLTCYDDEGNDMDSHEFGWHLTRLVEKWATASGDEVARSKIVQSLQGFWRMGSSCNLHSDAAAALMKAGVIGPLVYTIRHFLTRPHKTRVLETLACVLTVCCNEAECHRDRLMMTDALEVLVTEGIGILTSSSIVYEGMTEYAAKHLIALPLQHILGALGNATCCEHFRNVPVINSGVIEMLDLIEEWSFQFRIGELLELPAQGFEVMRILANLTDDWADADDALQLMLRYLNRFAHEYFHGPASDDCNRKWIVRGLRNLSRSAALLDKMTDLTQTLACLRWVLCQHSTRHTHSQTLP